MKIQTLVRVPTLWSFVKENLPNSLTAHEKTEGYGHVMGIFIKEPKTSFFDWNKPMIAFVDTDTITINHPEYFSDFEKLALKYEEKYKKEVTITVWQKE